MKLFTVSLRQLWADPVSFLAFGLGTGLSPVAPGTIGTLLAIPLYLFLASYTVWLYSAAMIILFFIGIWVCGQSAQNLGVHDHSGIVLDEIVGYLVTMLMVPPRWYWIMLGFVLFRLFDIWKPWPIRVIDQRVSGGTGIMLDDVIAGLFALAVLHVCIWVTGIR